MLDALYEIVDAFRGNISSNPLAGMKEAVHQLPLLYLLSATTSQTSYHDSTGVLKFVNPKIGTYGLTPNGNGGMHGISTSLGSVCSSHLQA